jgi:hypothetical protein
MRGTIAADNSLVVFDFGYPKDFEIFMVVGLCGCGCGCYQTYGFIGEESYRLDILTRDKVRHMYE